MGTNYTGAVIPPPGQDAVAPIPGSAPTIVNPADADARNAATLFTQQYQTFADFITYQQKSARWRPPLTPSAATGFTAVSHVGAGTGTVAPQAVPLDAAAGVSQTTTGNVSIVIKIIVGGAVATATFQWSSDGGATYGGTATTAATYTDGTTGIKVAFTGTFTANDTYAFQPTDTPQAQWIDSSGYVKNLISHNGLPFNYGLSILREDWINNVVSVSADGSIGITNWYFKLSGTGTCQSTQTVGGINGNYAQMHALNTNGSKSFLTQNLYFLPNPARSGLVCELEFEANLSSIATANAFYTIIFGLSNNRDPTSTNDYIWFKRTQNPSTNWFAETGTGGNSTSIDTGVAATASLDPSQRFKIEIYASGTPIGACVRFFIDGSLVAVSTTHITGGGLYLCLGTTTTATSTLNPTVNIGPILGIISRYQSLPVI